MWEGSVERKSRADEQESHRRRCRAGRAGEKPQSSCDQVPCGVNGAVDPIIKQATAHHLPAVQIQYRCQVQPALIGGQVGNVAAPDDIGDARIETPLYQIRRYPIFLNWPCFPGNSTVFVSQAIDPCHCRMNTPQKEVRAISWTAIRWVVHVFIRRSNPSR